MDYLKKGEIISKRFWNYFDKQRNIDENYGLSEDEARPFFRQLVKGIDYRKF